MRTALIALMVFSSLGCGLSREEKKEVGKIITALSPYLRRASLEQAAQLAFLNKEVTVSGGCTTDVSGCTISCTPSTTAFTFLEVKCSGSLSVGCGDDKYNLTDASFSSSLNADPISSTLPFAGLATMNVTANMIAKGGYFDSYNGVTIECSLAMTFDGAQLNDSDTKNDRNFFPSCDNFSCKLNNTKISCEDLQDFMKEQGGC